jgi:hypothetical protein
MNTRQATQQLAAFFESLSPDSVSRLAEFYDAQATFKDPFNEVKGGVEIERIFQHMFVALEQPHFVVTTQVVDGTQAFLTWDFRFRFAGCQPCAVQRARPRHNAPRLLGRRRRVVRKTARFGGPDALVENAGQPTLKAEKKWWQDGSAPRHELWFFRLCARPGPLTLSWANFLQNWAAVTTCRTACAGWDRVCASRSVGT